MSAVSSEVGMERLGRRARCGRMLPGWEACWCGVWKCMRWIERLCLDSSNEHFPVGVDPPRRCVPEEMDRQELT